MGSFCVPLYTFLSGYGLFTLYEKTQEHTMSPIRRSLKLLLNYWVVFAIFIPMGCIIAPEDYSLSTECILNFTTLINSYNNEWWFLFPYLLLVFTCKPFFQNHSPIIAKTRLDINKCYCNWLFSSILFTFQSIGAMHDEH